jgi:hypothetical protein
VTKRSNRMYWFTHLNFGIRSGLGFRVAPQWPKIAVVGGCQKLMRVATVPPRTDPRPRPGLFPSTATHEVTAKTEDRVHILFGCDAMRPPSQPMNPSTITATRHMTKRPR